jgi:hypothetical protein
MRYLRIIFSMKFILVFVLLFLTSCAVPLYFDKTEPAEISTEIKPCKLALVNIFNYTQPKTVKAENQIVYRNAISGFELELTKIGATDSLYKFFIADTLYKGILPENQSLLLPADTVVKLTSIYNSDYLITLDSLSFFLQEDEPDQTDESGMQLTLGRFYLISDFYLTLYDSSGNLINRSEVSMTVKFTTRIVMTYFSELQPSFSKAVVQAKELGISAADDYADKFYPVRTQEQRYVYTGGKLKVANELIVKEEWDKAREILDRLASGPRLNLSQKAVHNISVLKEIRESVTNDIKTTDRK